ncbi:5-oxoprolinase subunit C family protein [Thalassobacillus hwangdonensis]|uniref:Biotin-dependent carboxyltransferase family protein n=1 Tax=Thalassobacillus hwangdonensis TaxID=546108 RepID=A0ABW3L268_9BACI
MMKVMKSGLLTSIQDLGRYGNQKHGVIASGVMDPEAHRIANLLVGNEENASTMEITIMGPVLEFQEDALISICGADLTPMIDGVPVGMWRPIFIKRGSELRFGQIKHGCRSYLAVAGGYDVPEVMGSASTYLRAGIGGYKGRQLEKEDVISFLAPSEQAEFMIAELRETSNEQNFSAMDWYVATEFVPVVQPEEPIRIVKGREYDRFTTESQQDLEASSFKVDTKSDRMGYRLTGQTLQMNDKEDMISEAVAFGTIQVPAEGNPIILLADRQTTGGYPKIAQIATVDLPKIAQTKPGESITFTLISLEEAQRLYLERERNIQYLKTGIKYKFC